MLVLFLFRFLKEAEQKNTNAFSKKRAYEITSQAKFWNERCKDIWLRAISRAADEGLCYSYGDDACYYRVPWTFLSLALRDCFCDVQKTSNGGGVTLSDGDCPWSNISSRSYGTDSSFRARDLNDDELDFIRDLLRTEDGNTVNGREHKEFNSRRGDSACYASEGGDHLTNDEDWFSLEVFASFSQRWLGPVMDTLSKMPKDWAAIDPVTVHGFISRKSVARKIMETRQPGVFILRFSVRNPGYLILGFTYKVSKCVTRTEKQLASLNLTSKQKGNRLWIETFHLEIGPVNPLIAWPQ